MLKSMNFVTTRYVDSSGSARGGGGAREESCPFITSFWAVFPVRANPLRNFFWRYPP